MRHGSIITVEALETSNSAALIGNTDLMSVQTANGVVLFTSGRGGCWVTAFDARMATGEAQVRSEYQIPDGWLQPEATDLVFWAGATGGEVLFAGLGNTEMAALQISGTEASFDGTRIHTASGINFGTISQIFALNDQGHTLGGLRKGGLVQGQFSSTGQASVTQVTSDQGLTLMTLMPGGRLRVLDNFEGSFELPLNNITDIELAITGDTLRVWASTNGHTLLVGVQCRSKRPRDALESGCWR